MSPPANAGMNAGMGEGMGPSFTDTLAVDTPIPAHTAIDGRTTSDVLAFLAQTNNVFLDQIRTADQKATYIITFQLAILIWSLEVRDIFDVDMLLRGSLANTLASAALGAAILSTLVGAALVILPRHGKGGTCLYWNAWPEAGAPLARAALAGDRAWLMREYLANLDGLARIAKRKYAWVRFAYRSLIVMTACYFLAVIIK